MGARISERVSSRLTKLISLLTIVYAVLYQTGVDREARQGVNSDVYNVSKARSSV